MATSIGGVLFESSKVKEAERLQLRKAREKILEKVKKNKYSCLKIIE